MLRKILKCYVSIAVVSVTIFTISVKDLPVYSQIIPDTTLGSESTTVTPDTINNTTNIISRGATRGKNLFHSFESFSVPINGTAYFNNASNIRNIISRVTSGSVSNIDGILRANGIANLFLLNPNGIIFGPNAQLNIGGSFLATTANSLVFADNTQLNAAQSESSPLLTVSVPVGLDFSAGNLGSINVQGNGHNLFVSASTGAGTPVPNYNQDVGLKTVFGNTIALIGGNVNFDGGILVAPSGNIVVGSVASGSVNLEPSPTGLSLGFDSVQVFKEIELNKRTLLDASGFINGNIFLAGRKIALSTGSLILNTNYGDQLNSRISILASDSLKINGDTSLNSSQGVLAQGIIGQNYSSTKGAGITIQANTLELDNSPIVITSAFASGDGGNLTIQPFKQHQNNNNFYNSVALDNTSIIGTYTIGTGKSGDLELRTDKLSLQNGSIFQTTSYYIRHLQNSNIMW